MALINQEGRALARRLLDKIRKDQVSQSELAVRLGISCGQLSKLLRGRSSFARVSDGVLRAVADYLQMPVVQCFVLSGRLRHADFLETTGQSLSAAMEGVARSEQAVGLSLVAEDLQVLPQDVQLLIARLHGGQADTEEPSQAVSTWLTAWLSGSSSRRPV